MAMALCLAGSTESEASEADGATAQLLGWSEDGRSWAVLSSAVTESIEVYTDGKLVLTLCTIEDPDDPYGSDCSPSKTTKVIDVLDSDRYSGMQRVNIEKHKYLKPFKLKRLKSSMRKGFKTSYSIKGIGKSKDPEGKRCKLGWSVSAKSDPSSSLHEHKEKSGCVRAKGGFLHPSGKVALIKQLHSGEDSDDDAGYSTFEWESYILVALSKK